MILDKHGRNMSHGKFPKHMYICRAHTQEYIIGLRDLIVFVQNLSRYMTHLQQKVAQQSHGHIYTYENKFRKCNSIFSLIVRWTSERVCLSYLWCRKCIYFIGGLLLRDHYYECIKLLWLRSFQLVDGLFSFINFVISRRKQPTPHLIIY